MVISLGRPILLARGDFGLGFNDFVATFEKQKAPPEEPGRALAAASDYRPAAVRKSLARSVFSQVKVVKVSSPTVFCAGVRPKWP